MAKRRKKGNKISLFRKCIPLVASVVTFIFFFLEMLVVKGEVYNIFKGQNEVDSEGVSVIEVLFNEDYEFIRENFDTVTSILWIAFIVVIVSIVLTAFALIMKKSTFFSKLGSGLLVLGILLMFGINFYQLQILAIKTWISNITSLYFIALGLSVVGFASVVKLKK